MGSIRTSPGIEQWGRPSPERLRTTFADLHRHSASGPEGPNGLPACWPPMDRAARSHVLGFAAVLAVALLLHYGLLPLLGRRVGIRETPAYFLAVALVPVALWLISAFSRALARGAFETHRKLFGKGGVYVRLPGSEPIRLRDTFLMSIGPFAIDVLVMAEILPPGDRRLTSARGRVRGVPDSPPGRSVDLPAPRCVAARRARPATRPSRTRRGHSTRGVVRADPGPRGRRRDPRWFRNAPAHLRVF